MPTTARKSTTPRRKAATRRPATRKPNGKAEGMDRVRENMAATLGTIISDSGLTQTEAAFIMQDAPSQISLVTTGKLRGFSTERLLRMLARLGRDIDIVVKKSGKKHGAIRFVSA